MANAIFAVGSLVLALALLPTVIRKNPPAISTSLLTAVVLSLFVYAYATLHFWFSVGTGAMSAGLWWILLAQGIEAREAHV